MLIIILLVILIPVLFFFGGALIAMLGAMLAGIVKLCTAVIRPRRNG